MGADKLIFPGVGAFEQAMGVLRSKEYTEPLREYIQANGPSLHSFFEWDAAVHPATFILWHMRTGDSPQAACSYQPSWIRCFALALSMPGQHNTSLHSRSAA